MLKNKGANDVKVVSLLDKPSRRTVDLLLLEFTIENITRKMEITITYGKALLNFECFIMLFILLPYCYS